MPLLPPDHVEKLKDLFSGLTDKVTLVLFTQKADPHTATLALTCESCADTETLLTELVGLSDRLTLETHDFVTEVESARAAGIDKIPAIIVKGALSGERVRYFGMPAGYEFASFIEDVIDVGRGSVDLPAAAITALAELEGDVHLQVFASPTCPYCPEAVRVAHRFAMAGRRVTADCVVVGEFPHLAQKYAVMGVPRTVINETVSFDGALSESEVLEKVLAAGAGTAA